MAKRKQKEVDVCPNCGTKVEKPEKTWNLISPLPDAQGRITITVMGSYVCPKCGHKWRGVVSKIRAGGSSVEVEGKKGVKKIGDEENKQKDEGEIIELDLSDLDEEE
ncbi:chromatin protein Cren7 [Acidianus sulfidivorans JP7]|uniref:Chromatin protein Cren7 n=1 Tax=Acidianus sulfidivorans JP7 TaxID=619593 RepID=A0A2U9IP12_9CREN|nr:chromatin protein Cren7 [Acidianus sulfidivorans]AWR97741.1 chromatin protein Cren7 [Acidianus sulfidivorans JP7]